MGYTHYFEREPELGKEEFELFAKDVAKIFAFAKENGILLADGSGEKGTLPVADGEMICFNGLEDDSYETMAIDRIARERPFDGRGKVFGFCKTARKPYDKIVTAVLVCFKRHFPNVEIDSDGGEEGFDEGKRICDKLFENVPELELGAPQKAGREERKIAPQKAGREERKIAPQKAGRKERKTISKEETQYELTKSIQQTNQYYFTVKASSKEEAEKKLDEFLERHSPNPFQLEEINGVNCYDRECDI